MRRLTLGELSQQGLIHPLLQGVNRLPHLGHPPQSQLTMQQGLLGGFLLVDGEQGFPLTSRQAQSQRLGGEPVGVVGVAAEQQGALGLIAPPAEAAIDVGHLDQPYPVGQQLAAQLVLCFWVIGQTVGDRQRDQAARRLLQAAVGILNQIVEYPSQGAVGGRLHRDAQIAGIGWQRQRGRAGQRQPLLLLCRPTLGRQGDPGLQAVHSLVGDTQLTVQLARQQLGERQAQVIGAGDQIQ